jgi:uncharacterized heparinase superfamily protein
VLEDGEVLLRSKSGIRWRFSSAAGISLEESIYVREDENPVPSLQIVLAGQTGASQTILGWELRREKL